MTWESGPAEAPKTITVLGSTGSIGKSTIDLLARAPERFVVEALTANRNVELLAEQAKALNAKCAVVADGTQYLELKQMLSGTGIEVAAGAQAVIEATQRPTDQVMASIVGSAGLAPTLAAVRRGATVLLANKEALVCAGSLMREEVERHGATLLPVDSEHNAIFQVFDFNRRETIDHITLTASGGPFRTYSLEEMAGVTPQQAVAHPNWSMGAKISVDSATMMNKGLELIEAAYLFDLPEEKIEVLVHPQSVIHSTVTYIDGSVLAQMGEPDMRTPIAYALAWPSRIETPVQRLDLARIGQLSFEQPDPVRFPALSLARNALRRGGGSPVVLNAANEAAVEAFLQERLSFTGIPDLVAKALDCFGRTEISSLEEIDVLDREVRCWCEAEIASQ